MQQVTIEIKQVYGNETIYPVCDNAKLFATIAGTKTLTRASLQCIKALGYEIVIKQKEFAI